MPIRVALPWSLVALSLVLGFVAGPIAPEPEGVAAAPAAAPAAALDLTDRYIVVLDNAVSDPGAVAQQIALGASGAPGAWGDNGNPRQPIQVSHVYGSAIKGFAARIPPEAVDAVRNNPRVLAVEPDRPVSIQAQSLPNGVDRIGADSNGIARINGVDERVNADIAILDTGVGPHPDLNVVGGYDCTGMGFYTDNHGHGTLVAGIAGALDNGIGVVGVAPGARLWSVKVLEPSGGSWSYVICGIDWVARNAATIEVANMSIGENHGPTGGCANSAIHIAVCNAVNAGVTFAVAGGNGDIDAGNYVPAQYDEVITVSAMNDSDGKPGGLGPITGAGPDDAFASFSNFGADVDIAAPGASVLSTARGGGYARDSGTSFATPHVAGAAALYIARNGRVGPAAVKSGLLAARERLSLAGDPDGIAEGVLNVADAAPPPTATPTRTATPVPPTATRTPTRAATATPVPPTATRTPTRAATATPVPPTATRTPTLAPTAAPGSAYRIAGSGKSAGSASSGLVFDKNLSTAWSTTASGSPPASAYVYVDLGAAKPIGAIRWYYAAAGSADDVQIQTSLNRVNWQNVVRRGNDQPGTWHYQATSGSARYVRFYFLNPNRDATLGALAEIEILAPGGVIPPPTATRTAVPPTATRTATAIPPTATGTATAVPPTATRAATATAIPVTATATATATAVATPYRIAGSGRSANSGSSTPVYDRNEGTYWISTLAATPPATAYVYVDLGAARPIGAVQWVFAVDGIADSYRIQVSNDRATWVDLAAQPYGNAGTGVWLELKTLTTARYVRWIFANPNADPQIGGLAEVRVWP